ncbi:hypothetical protein ES705_16389 [subsurface metagenome]
MSKERLSRLQKWILKFLYVKKDFSVSTKSMKYWMLYKHKEQGFEGKPLSDNFHPTKNNIDAAVSRSIRNLYSKELIDVGAGLGPGEIPKICTGIDGMEEMQGPYYGINVKFLFLTDEGMAKARELLNVKKLELNNKNP